MPVLTLLPCVGQSWPDTSLPGPGRDLPEGRFCSPTCRSPPWQTGPSLHPHSPQGCSQLLFPTGHRPPSPYSDGPKETLPGCGCEMPLYSSIIRAQGDRDRCGISQGPSARLRATIEEGEILPAGTAWEGPHHFPGHQFPCPTRQEPSPLSPPAPFSLLTGLPWPTHRAPNRATNMKPKQQLMTASKYTVQLRDVFS